MSPCRSGQGRGSWDQPLNSQCPVIEALLLFPQNPRKGWGWAGTRPDGGEQSRDLRFCQLWRKLILEEQSKSWQNGGGWAEETRVKDTEPPRDLAAMIGQGPHSGGQETTELERGSEVTYRSAPTDSFIPTSPVV